MQRSPSSQAPGVPGVHSGGTVVEVLLVAPVDDVLLSGEQIPRRAAHVGTHGRCAGDWWWRLVDINQAWFS